MTTIVLALIALLTLGFVAMNWTLVSQPADLFMGFGTVHAPLGLVMLGLLALVALVFWVLLATTRAAALQESHRLLKEVEAQRQLADSAEASRFTDLRKVIADDLAARAATQERRIHELGERVEGLQLGLMRRMDEQAELMAHLRRQADAAAGAAPITARNVLPPPDQPLR